MVLLIVLISLPVYAEIRGHVSVDYDTLNRDCLGVECDKHLQTAA